MTDTTPIERFCLDCRRAGSPDVPKDRDIALAGLVETPFFPASEYGVVRARLMAAVRNLALAAEAARGDPVVVQGICFVIASLGVMISALAPSGASRPLPPRSGGGQDIDPDSVPYKPGVD
jgi:hypothetical protein